MDSLITANLKQRPLRTAVSIIGVAVGVVLVVLTVGLARGMTRDAAERQGNVHAELRMYPPGNISISTSPLMLRSQYADAILKGVNPTAEDPDIEPKPPVPGVTATTPVAEWMQSTGAGLGFELVDGIDYSSFIKTSELNIVKGRGLGDGLTPESQYEVIVDPFYAKNGIDNDGKVIDVGSKITVLSHEFTVVGIYEPSQLARVKIPISTMQQLFGGNDNCTFVMIRVGAPDMVEKALASLKEFYPGNTFVRTSELPELFSQGYKPVEVFLDVVIGLAVVISTLVILLAMYTTIIERTREIGILKSMGASKPFIVMAIEKEAVIISALGVLVGFVFSVAGKYGIEASTRLQIDLLPQWLLIAAFIAVLGGVVGALYPAVRAASLDPVEALGYD
ncbi:MAG TPA: ABC transporter permease [Blastocatellia bacterium]|jgi:putative ABC transport system permease protein|nr:ABC transporter permease [Blastocatellia bacterium]